MSELALIDRSAVCDPRFASLGTPGRIWAVSAIHADSGRLMMLHDWLLNKFRCGDRVIYMGNYIGHGASPRETIDELLAFRRMVLSVPGVNGDDVVYLRGGQEEIWQKLLQVQFSPDPVETLGWMLDNGMAATLNSYGISTKEGLVAAHEGVMSLTKWTARIRDSFRRHPGHESFSTHWRRAAFTSSCNQRGNDPLLFVHAGLNPRLPLEEQGDSFWWAGKSFSQIHSAYDPFAKVVRGFDPAHGGINLNCVTATIDGGCGFGGALVCAGFDRAGSIFDIIEC